MTTIGQPTKEQLQKLKKKAEKLIEKRIVACFEKEPSGLFLQQDKATISSCAAAIKLLAKENGLSVELVAGRVLKHAQRSASEYEREQHLT
jgi:hypothetical protein